MDLERAFDLPSWLVGPWERLQHARLAERLPHALLVTGVAGVGKRRLIEGFFGALLCAQSDAQGYACGKCADCALLAAGTHPDLVIVKPDEDTKSQEIKVAAIRELIGTEALTSHRGRWKLVLLDPAHRMNTSAANALLKTLEEPASDTLICLVSERPNRLAATIRSRCQTLQVPLPDETEALAWLSPRLHKGEPSTILRLAHGAPLRALGLADEECLSLRDRIFSGFVEVGIGKRDPVAEATTWNKLEPAILLDWLGGWISDLLRLTVGQPEPALTNPDKADDLSSLAARLDLAAAHRYLQRVWDASADDLSNLNRLLVYESLLVAWAGVTRSATVQLQG